MSKRSVLSAVMAVGLVLAVPRTASAAKPMDAKFKAAAAGLAPSSSPSGATSTPTRARLSGKADGGHRRRLVRKARPRGPDGDRRDGRPRRPSRRQARPRRHDAGRYGCPAHRGRDPVPFASKEKAVVDGRNAA